MSEVRYCACGCGEEIDLTGWRRSRNVKYVRWHWQRTHSARAYTPRPDEIPSGLCECGCGGATSVARETNREKRSFRGHPLPYLPHHRPRADRGPKSHKWKGGRIRHRDYWLVYARDHPNANGRGYIYEHRLVMEEHLGRLLLPHETVHHKNGDGHDNRIENLELRVGKHGVGATHAHCATCRCFEGAPGV